MLQHIVEIYQCHLFWVIVILIKHSSAGKTNSWLHLIPIHTVQGQIKDKNKHVLFTQQRIIALRKIIRKERVVFPYINEYFQF